MSSSLPSSELSSTHMQPLLPLLPASVSVSVSSSQLPMKPSCLEGTFIDRSLVIESLTTPSFQPEGCQNSYQSLDLSLPLSSCSSTRTRTKTKTKTEKQRDIQPALPVLIQYGNVENACQIESTFNSTNLQLSKCCQTMKMSNDDMTKKERNKTIPVTSLEKGKTGQRKTRKGKKSRKGRRKQSNLAWSGIQKAYTENDDEYVEMDNHESVNDEDDSRHLQERKKRRKVERKRMSRKKKRSFESDYWEDDEDDNEDDDEKEVYGYKAVSAKTVTLKVKESTSSVITTTFQREKNHQMHMKPWNYEDNINNSRNDVNYNSMDDHEWMNCSKPSTKRAYLMSSTILEEDHNQQHHQQQQVR